MDYINIGRLVIAGAIIGLLLAAGQAIQREKVEFIDCLASRPTHTDTEVELCDKILEHRAAAGRLL